MRKFVLIVILLCGIVPCSGGTIYVDANAPGANNGSNWAEAFNFLQDALYSALSGDSIWVAQGTYRPDANTAHPGGTNDRTATFQLKNGVAIYGGFPSGGGVWESRDPNLHQTILSGDINVPDNNSDNSSNVVTGSGTDPTAILNGLTITKGNGSGMYNYSGSPTITNCTFSYNYGCGMYNGDDDYYDGSSPTITNCTFIGNSAGGGMNNYYYNSPTLTNCTFIGNSADHSGGGMSNTLSNPILINCTFSGNSASGSGGGMYNYTGNPGVFNCAFNYNTSGERGGAIGSGYYCFPGIVNCTFTGNSATNGGGIWQELGTLTVTNCTFTGNSATNGGGINNNYYGTTTMTNCTFSGNSASNSGGGMYDYDYSDTSTITNCIFWGNTAPTGAQIYNGENWATVSFSDVQGGWEGTGNIDANPLFVDANGPDGIVGTEDDNLRLLSDSPCIDTANNSAVPPGIETDLDGRDRFVDGDCNDTDIVDIGAFEFTYAYIGDFDSDCEVDFTDFAIQASFWLTDELLVDIAPTPAGDGIVDIYDLAVMCDNWLAGK